MKNKWLKKICEKCRKCRQRQCRSYRLPFNFQIIFLGKKCSISHWKLRNKKEKKEKKKKTFEKMMQNETQNAGWSRWKTLTNRVEEEKRSKSLSAERWKWFVQYLWTSWTTASGSGCWPRRVRFCIGVASAESELRRETRTMQVLRSMADAEGEGEGWVWVGFLREWSKSNIAERC